MNKRKLGRTNWDVSEIGFGGWGIGKKWWGQTDDQNSRDALRIAWDQGINFFDTAYVYGDGHSEELIGEALKGKPAFIATKIPPKNDVWPADPQSNANDAFPADWIISCTERSLKKLKREYVDVQQLHVWSDKWLETDEWKEAVQKLKTQGKIKAFGVSINDHQPNSALGLVESGLADSVQVIFNIFDQSPKERLFPHCKKYNVGIIVRVPFDEGSLTGTLTKDTAFEEDDFRKDYFRGDKLTQTVERVEKLKPLIQNGMTSLAQLALKYILSHDEVSVVIPGMRKANHVLANVQASMLPSLKADTKAALGKHAWARNFYGWWDE